MSTITIEISPFNKSAWRVALTAKTVTEAKVLGPRELHDKLKDHDFRIMSDGEDVSYRGPYDHEWVDV